MKKKYILFLLLGFMACNTSELKKDFNCNSDILYGLEELTDFKNKFKVKFPKTWKTSYFYNDIISSIYTADTTLSLTQTTIIDVSFVLNPIKIDSIFVKKIQIDNENMKLKEVKSKMITFLEKQTYYNLSKGIKGKFNYQILNVFTKSVDGFLHIKTEVYGDSLVNERICKAVNLIDKIQLK